MPRTLDMESDYTLDPRAHEGSQKPDQRVSSRGLLHVLSAVLAHSSHPAYTLIVAVERDKTADDPTGARKQGSIGRGRCQRVREANGQLG